MTVTLGILALLEARPGKGSELAELLKKARELAMAEDGTVSWYAFKISDTSYGIFDTFATDGARSAHINGQIPAALARVSADLLAAGPDIRPVDVLAFK
jgi:quinol monooxygenase YgiN